ncbi:MAG: undecaprenyldiphospho-muramoylpentapeptide beta-N-acetylglucosaminyltransferase [Proteobacteria bacterium]|nr:undecaprenyldiphospho-muramoylpentapeptide beta-N-acetylglucosaminyltransferase [Pseudomonadota bacterium]
MSRDKPHLLMMAGGTGGHIFPGLAIARAMRERGWRVSWLGTPRGMEQTLVPQDIFRLHAIAFEGVVGRGAGAKLMLPLRLARAYREARRLLRELRPDVVIGMGGYPTVPGGLAAARGGIALAIHQSDAVAGLANRVLARVADRVLVGFATVFPQYASKRVVTGNPIRAEFARFAEPSARFVGREGALSVLLMGGSRGAEAINALLPAALRLLPAERRPRVVHQTGRGAKGSTAALYEAAGVDADLVEFIDDAATALARCDLFIGRSGASTVAELAAMGVASLLIPYPHHKDQQQLRNARVLSDVGAAEVLEQPGLTAERLAQAIGSLTRERCLQMANAAHTLARPDATAEICTVLASLAPGAAAGSDAKEASA